MSSPEAIVRLTDVVAGWLLTYLLHSTVMLVAVWAIASLRRVSDTVREVLWKSALVGGIVTATVQTAATREPLAGQWRLAPRTGGPHASVMRVAVPHMPGTQHRLFLVRPKGTRWTAGLVVLWLTTAGAGLLWLTAAHARSLRALGDRMPLGGTPIGQRLRQLLARAGIDRAIELTCSPAIASPVALPGDEVCLPRRALLELEPAEQESMLAHEVAHVVRRDPQWLVAARAIEIVLFFQPLNRLARHRLQEIAEYLCDDWAVARTSRPITLAKCLAAVAEWVGRAPRSRGLPPQPMAAMVESGGSPLVRRVGRILSGRVAPQPRTSRVASAASVCALVVLAGVAPRVSVANAATRRVAFVREVVEQYGVVATHDTIVVFRSR